MTDSNGTVPTVDDKESTEITFSNYLIAVAYGIFKKRKILPVAVAYPPLAQHGVFSFYLMGTSEPTDKQIRTHIRSHFPKINDFILIGVSKRAPRVEEEPQLTPIFSDAETE